MDFSTLINRTSPFPLRVAGWYFAFIKFDNGIMIANNGEPDQTPRFVESGLVLHCLSVSHKKRMQGL